MKPILFNTDMVRAILDNRKMVTRRVVKPRYCDSVFEMFKDGLCEASIDIPPRDNGDGTTTHFVRAYVPCKAPYRPGDILYVREAFHQTPNGQYWYKADNLCKGCTEDGFCIPRGVKYHKTCKICDYYDGYQNIKWRTSIYMPREAARIFLKVTDVRAERLWEIDGRGILAEGIDDGSSNPAMGKRFENMQRMAFQRLWNSTIKKADRALYGWAANPWVWVIEFERINGEDVRKWHSAKL